MSDREHESDNQDLPGESGGSAGDARTEEPARQPSPSMEEGAVSGGDEAVVSASGEPEAPTLGDVLAEIEAEVETGPAADGPEPGATLDAADRPGDEIGVQMLLFSQGGNRFAVEIESVLEVGPVPEHTWVPGVPGWVRGVANFRGEIISIVALGELLGLGQGDVAPGSRRMLVARALGGPVRSGLIVDGVHGNVRLARKQIRPLGGPVQEGVAPYLSGLLQAKGELHALLDVERLLLSDTFRALGSVRRRLSSHVV